MCLANGWRTAPSSLRTLGDFDYEMVGLMLGKPDFSALREKSLNEVANHAENLARSALEDRFDAHAISGVVAGVGRSSRGARKGGGYG